MRRRDRGRGGTPTHIHAWSTCTHPVRDKAKKKAAAHPQSEGGGGCHNNSKTPTTRGASEKTWTAHHRKKKRNRSKTKKTHTHTMIHHQAIRAVGRRTRSQLSVEEIKRSGKGGIGKVDIFLLSFFSFDVAASLLHIICGTARRYAGREE